MRPRRARLAPVFSIMLTLSTLGSLARATDIFDGEFTTGWEFVQVTTGNGGSFSVGYGSDGNPGTYLITNTHTNANCGAIYGFGFKTDSPYDPAVKGPIEVLSYSEDAKLVNGFGGGQANGPAIRQGGSVYRIPGIATGTNFSWYALNLGLDATSFVKVLGGSCGSDVDEFSHPDFSENGAPIEFGFSRANSQIDGQGAYDISAGIDNWHVSVNGVVYAALGDSFSSGEGVRPFISGSDVPNGNPKNVCHRSTQAYGFQLHYPEVHLNLQSFIACSGAVTNNVKAGGQPPEAGPGELPQLAQHFPPPRDGIQVVNDGTDMVTLSIGGNDLGFVPIAITCSLVDDCASPAFKPFGPTQPSFKQAIEAKLPSVGAAASQTYFAVRGQAENASVFVMGYPRLFGNGNCPFPLGVFSSSEKKWLDALGDKLNLTLQAAASGAGIHFIHVAGTFKNHEICGNQPWINPLVVSDMSASFHPRAVGQWAYARTLDIYMNNWKNAGNPLSPAGIPANLSGLGALAPPKAAPLGAGTPSLGGLFVGPFGETFCDARGNFVAGQQVEITGAEFGAGAGVTLTLSSGAYSSAFATATADGNGHLDAAVTLPAGAPTNADALVQASGTGGLGEPRLLVTRVRLSTSFFSDADFDGIPDPCDTCPGLFDPKGFDADFDGIGDSCDVCPLDVENDVDGDGTCASADPCPWDAANDADGDDRCESRDNCPLVANASQADADNDGAGDPCDAAPTNSGAFALPGEVGDLAFDDDKLALAWTSAAPASGALTVHDLARGALDAFPVGAGACVSSGVSGDRSTDATLPAPGHGFWYLVRARNSIGTGTYGYRSSGSERITSSCP
jgi:hypothetical protein